MPSFVVFAALWASWLTFTSAQEHDDRRHIMRGHHRHHHSGEDDGDYTISIDSDGRVHEKPLRRRHHRRLHEDPVCSKSQACHLFQGRYRPQVQHRTRRDLTDLPMEFLNEPSLNELSTADYDTPAPPPVLGGAAWGPYDALPSTLFCTLGVDDTLDGVYYNGVSVALTSGSLSTLCPATPITFQFTPVSNGTLLIIAHDTQPGTGLASCAGIGISCGTAPGSIYPQFADWTSWRVRAQSNSQQSASGFWNVVGPGTSSSLSCGINVTMPITMWQSGSIYVAAMWTTPQGTTTTTTTTTTITTTVLNTTNLTVLKAACPASFSWGSLLWIGLAWVLMR